MSAYSTLRITRSAALKAYYSRFNPPTDEQLEDFLDQILECRLYNAVIVDDGEINDDSILDT